MIRQATPRDLMGVYAVVNSSLDDYFAETTIEFFMAQWPEGQFVSADLFGRIDGALCGAILDRGRVTVSLLAVDSGSRGRGVGTALMDGLKRRCFMEGRTTIQLEVRTTNANAIRFYRRNGFEISETLPSFYNDGGSAYRMVCRLSGRPSLLPECEVYGQRTHGDDACDQGRDDRRVVLLDRLHA